MKFIGRVLVQSALLALAACQAAPPEPAADSSEIVVGVAGPMTGDLASFGAQLQHGAEKAVSDINASGGVLGKKLRLVVGDDRCKPERAPQTASGLVDSGIVLVVGHFCSGVSIPASEVYHDAGVLQITPASSNPRLTDEAADEGWNTLFRTCGRDDAQGEIAGAWLAQHFAGQRVAFVHDGSGYGQLLTSRARKAMNGAGLKEAMSESIAPGRTDYAGLVAELREAEIDAVFFGGYHVEAAKIVRGMREQKLSAAFFGGDALQTLEFAELAGNAASGVRFTSQPEWRMKPSAEGVVTAFRASGFEPEGYTLPTYAAFQVWAAAVAKAGTTDAEKVAAVMRGQSWDTVIGPLAFDRKGDVVKPEYVWYEFLAGGYEEVGL